MYGSELNSPEDAFLRYAYAESASGRLLVLMSRRGVVDVILGDDRVQLLKAAAKRFPSMGFIPDRGVHSEWVAVVVKRIELPEPCVVIPVDVGFDSGLRAAG